MQTAISRVTDSREAERVTAVVLPGMLLMLNGPEAGRLLEIRSLPCRLGRGGNSELILAPADDPPTISREHLTLSQHGNDLLVTDHSRNGTRVGDRWLRPQEVERWLPGQMLQLGPLLQLRRVVSAIPQETPTVQSPPQEMACSATQTVAASRLGQLRSFLLAPETLQTAWKRVRLNRGGAGPDGITVADFAANPEERLLRLQDLLRRGRYEPLPPRLFAAPKRSGGVRTIAILSIQDRIVQQALHAALQPVLESHLPSCSFAYRPGMGTQEALRRVDTLLNQGLTWVVEADIADFFDSISHRILLEKLTALVPDPFVLSLVARCMAAGAVLPGGGLAQGAATSPLFSNLYLAEFDKHLLSGGWNPARYGDDLLIPCASRNRGQAVLAEAEGYLRSRLNLRLRAEKTRLVPLKQGFTFLGFRFTEAGRQASPEAMANLEARLREAKPEDEAAVRRGWKTYFGPVGANMATQATSQTDNSPFGKQGDVLSAPDEEWITRFLALFGGREDVYARQTGMQGPGAFVSCTGKLTPELVRRHVAGEETLATYLLHTDDMVRSLVMDVDAVRRPGRPGKPNTSDYDLEPVIAFAQDLAGVCRRFGLPTRIEDSGLKGRHLWLFFSEAVQPDAARRLARLLAAQAGFPCPGVRLEILPRHSEWPGPQLGDAVKLPFGVHPVTGRRCFLLDQDGEPIGDREIALAGIRTVSAAEVESVTKLLMKGEEPTKKAAKLQGTHSDAPSSAVTRLVQGCTVVQGLVENARKTGHLRHTHQLILLYTAGHLGLEGAAFLHRTIALCRNYDAAICQGYIDRLEANHPPISCRRIREWLEEDGETGLCTCAQTCRTPLEHCASAGREMQNSANAGQETGKRTAIRKSPPRVPAVANSVWAEMAADLFAMDEGQTTEMDASSTMDASSSEEAAE